MSMICSLRRATAEEIDKLLAEPDLALAFTSGGKFDPGAPEKVGCLGRLLGVQPGEPVPSISLPSDWPELKAEDELCLDKTWHGIHFLLTGSDWQGEEPLCYLVKGGQAIGEVDVGYGPARALRAEQVKQFAAALEQVPDEALRERFDAAKMMAEDIYPTIWDEGRSAREYLMEHFPELKSFVKQTADQGKALVIWLA